MLQVSFFLTYLNKWVPFLIVGVTGCKQRQLLLIPAPGELAWSLKPWGWENSLEPGSSHVCHIFLYFYKPTNGHCMLQRRNQPLSWNQCHFYGEIQAFGCSPSNGKKLLRWVLLGLPVLPELVGCNRHKSRRPLKSLLCDLQPPIAFQRSFKVQSTETELFWEIVFSTRV